MCNEQATFLQPSFSFSLNGLQECSLFITQCNIFLFPSMGCKNVACSLHIATFFFFSMDELDMNFVVIISVQPPQEALRKRYLNFGPSEVAS